MSVPLDVCSATSKDHLFAAVNAYNAMVSQPDAISVESVLDVPPRQHSLSSRIEDADFNYLFSDASTVTKARLHAEAQVIEDNFGSNGRFENYCSP